MGLNAKIFKNIKRGNIREISILGLPIYKSESKTEYTAKSFCLNLCQIEKFKNTNNTTQTIKFLNIKIFHSITNAACIDYFLFNRLIKKENFTEKFYTKYLKNIKYDFDDIYILNSNIGELYLFFAYLAKAFLDKNKSKKPLFIGTKKYHLNILKTYIPDAQYIYTGKLKLLKENNQWNIHGHNCFVIYSTKDFRNIVHNITDNTHYLTSIINALSLSENDISKPNFYITSEIEKRTLEKANTLKLNLDKFVILSPEALTCNKIPMEFWQNLAAELQKQGYQIFLNITDKSNTLSGCKTANLDLQELFCLAQRAKAVISLRSGLTEFLLPTETPNITIYTRHRIINGITLKSAQTMECYSMLELPYVNKNNIAEINAEDVENEDALLALVKNSLAKILNEEENLV